MKNPIQDNRMVSDYTYAVRNLMFLCSVWQGGIPTATCSVMDEEEFDYLCRTACDLLRYQVETCPSEEKKYFENLVKGYRDGNDIIENHVCKYHSEFFRYLKIIKAV